MCLTALMVIFATGCGSSPPLGANSKTAARPTPVYEGPSKVEISNPMASWKSPSIVQLEIPYRFTSGGPGKTYLWKILFPGSTTSGNRPTEAWEMQVEGVQTTGIQVGETDVSNFTAELWEAETPERPYYLISNVAEGAVPGRAVRDVENGRSVSK